VYHTGRKRKKKRKRRKRKNGGSSHPETTAESWIVEKKEDNHVAQVAQVASYIRTDKEIMEISEIIFV